MLEVWGPVKFLWALAGSDAYIVRSCEPLDVPIREHSASNAGVPTDSHSPESNSSYLARI